MAPQGGDERCAGWDSRCLVALESGEGGIQGSSRAPSDQIKSKSGGVGHLCEYL